MIEVRFFTGAINCNYSVFYDIFVSWRTFVERAIFRQDLYQPIRSPVESLNTVKAKNGIRKQS